MSKFHDDTTAASDPGRVALSRERLERLKPDYGGLRGWWWRFRFDGGRTFAAFVEEHLNLGDSRAAAVVSIEPLLVAAYTDELDCVAMLGFPSKLVAEYGLRRGSPLLTVNTYMRGPWTVRDLLPGPENSKRFTNFYPLIADFLSDDVQRIRQRKGEIAKEEWQRCWDMGCQYLQRFPGRCRNGLPWHSRQPAK